ncbi:MAG: hypothetical protein FJZ78_09770 [Bacteroidetes bacterium]|nr:hypothetical protein [Bacteroidota bacterium]
MTEELSRAEIQRRLKLIDKRNFLKNYLLPALNLGLIEMTVPEKPKSSRQRYRLTTLGAEFKRNN